MPLMMECAITPAVFDAMHFSGDEIIGNFALLSRALLNEGIIRNLYGGEWLNTINDPNRERHLRGKELLKILGSQKRLRSHLPSNLPLPNDDHSWCEEALLSHKNIPLGGIVTMPETATHYSKKHPLIASINKLSNAQWWENRGSSARLCRNTSTYREHLRLILEFSNSLIFIDRNLDPTRTSYREFIKLFEVLKTREVLPLIEIHRSVSASERGGKWMDYSIAEWKNKFSGTFSELVRQTGIKIEVFLWEKNKNMHDRFLISNIFGIAAANGFDIGITPEEITLWTCVSRNDREAIADEYDPVCNPRHLHGRFVIKGS